jgi:hypothetical protein
MILYGVSWIEWAEPASMGRKAMKRRRQQIFSTAEERERFLAVEKEKDDFLWVLDKWEENRIS